MPKSLRQVGESAEFPSRLVDTRRKWKPQTAADEQQEIEKDPSTTDKGTS